MIKTEEGIVEVGFHDPAEICADFAVITRTVYSSLKREWHMSDEEAKQKVRDLTEEALKFKVADTGHMKTPDLVAQILRDIFEGGSSCI